MSKDVHIMSRSVVVDEAFPPVPFEEPRKNATVLAYSAFHDPRNRPAGPLGSFLGWLRTVASVSETGVVRLRSASCGTVGVAVRYRGYTSDAFLGQLCSMVLPHGGPQAFEGGPDRAFALNHLLGCRCLVGALAYLGSLRVAEGARRAAGPRGLSSP